MTQRARHLIQKSALSGLKLRSDEATIGRGLCTVKCCCAVGLQAIRKRGTRFCHTPRSLSSRPEFW